MDSVVSARAAERGGARRIELCDNLGEGGTTPSAGMIAAVVSAVRIPVYVILRPRGGDFVYSDAELDVMCRDARVVHAAGAAGVVVGALHADSTVDVARTQSVIAAAGVLPVTFHRAFDLVPDPAAALETLIGIGVERVLTSGGATSALDGVPIIRQLVTQADGRIAIMAGGGLQEENVAEVVRRSGVREVHVRGTRVVHGAPRVSAVGFRTLLLGDESDWEETDATRIASMVRVVEER